MDKLLLIVEDSFQITGRCVIVLPALSPEAVGSDENSGTAGIGFVRVASVRLVRPDTTEEVVEGTFYWAHFNPQGYRFTLELRGAEYKKEQVPPGTEIWLLDA